MKKLILITCLLFSFGSYAQDGRVEDETQSAVLTDINGGGGSRVLDDITGGGGRGVQLLNLQRIEGTSNFEITDARPKVQALMNRGYRSDMALRMMKLKVMADLKEIAEITLKDGTVLKAEDILKGE